MSEYIEISWKDIVYQGILVDEKSRKKIIDMFSAFSNLKEFLKYIKNDLHMTCIFQPKKEEIYVNNVLGKEVILQVISVGVLKNEKGEVTNIGIRIKDSNHYSNNKVAHVTTMVLNNGKAVDTAKCTWRWNVDFTITGKFAVFDKDNNAFFKVKF